MSHSPNIGQQDRVFLARVISDSVKAGTINSSQWNGRTVEPNVGLPCCLCLCPSGGNVQNSRERDVCVIIVSIFFFVISFFVGAYYTKESVQSYMTAKSDLKTAKSKGGEIEAIQYQKRPSAVSPEYEGEEEDLNPASRSLYPSLPTVVQMGCHNMSVQEVPYSPQYMVPSPSIVVQNPPSYYSVSQNPSPYETHTQSTPTYSQLGNQQSPKFQVMEIDVSALKHLYNEAAKILTYRKDERKIAAISQGLMTLGAGFLTVALLIALVAEPEIFAVGSAASGAGLIGVGGLIFIVKQGCFTREKENAQKAADFIMAALSEPKNSHKNAVYG